MIDYWFNTTYGCGLVTTNRQKKVVKTCPIYKWMIGNGYDYVINYLLSKRQFKGDKIISEYLSEAEKLEDEEKLINEIQYS